MNLDGKIYCFGWNWKNFVAGKSMADTAGCVSGHTRMTLGHTRMRWPVGAGHGVVRMPVRVPIRGLEGDTRMGGSHTRMR